MCDYVNISVASKELVIMFYFMNMCCYAYSALFMYYFIVFATCFECLLCPIPHIVWDYVDTAALYDHVITLSL